MSAASTIPRSYLDHAASTPLLPEVAQAMAEVQFLPGNPSSAHTSGRRRRALLEEARESVAADLGATPAEVVFTSGGTESDNLAVLGGQAARIAAEPEREAVVISAVEHPAVAAIRQQLGELVRVVPVTRDGQLDRDAFARALDARVGLVSVMWVNNETGAVQPVSDLADQARAVGAWMHSDAVQAVGQVPVDFAGSGLDLLSLSAHKIGGPVGIGALLMRRGVRLRPSGFGGPQERELRPGTSAVTLAVGLAGAVRLAVARQATGSVRTAALRERVVAAALGLGASVNGGGPASSAIVNLCFPGCRAVDLLLLLDRSGIDCSAGSACAAGVARPSEVLLAMGRSEAEASGSLRFSFGPQTTHADIDRLLAALPEAVALARAAL